MRACSCQEQLRSGEGKSLGHMGEKRGARGVC